MSLTAAEIQHICHLLLHEDHKNVTLAKTLLESCYREALPQMRDQAILYTLFYPEDEQVGAWAVECFGAEAVEGHPIAYLATAYHTPFGHQTLPKNYAPLLMSWRQLAADVERDPERALAYGQLYENSKMSLIFGREQFYDLAVFLLEKAIAHYFKDFRQTQSIHEWREDLVTWLALFAPNEKQTPQQIERIQELYRTIEAHRANGNALYQCGHFFETRQRDWEKAAAYYDEGLAQHPYHLKLTIGRARIYRRQGAFEQSFERLMQPLHATASPNAFVRSQLYQELAASQWQEQGEWSDGVAYYRKGMPGREPQADWRWADKLLEAPNGWQRLMQLFERVLAASPNAALVYADWGAFCESQERLPEALQVYKAAAHALESDHFDHKIKQLSRQLHP